MKSETRPRHDVKKIKKMTCIPEIRMVYRHEGSDGTPKIYVAKLDARLEPEHQLAVGHTLPSDVSYFIIETKIEVIRGGRTIVVCWGMPFPKDRMRVVTETGPMGRSTQYFWGDKGGHCSENLYRVVKDFATIKTTTEMNMNDGRGDFPHFVDAGYVTTQMAIQAGSEPLIQAFIDCDGRYGVEQLVHGIKIVCNEHQQAMYKCEGCVKYPFL